MSDFQQLKLRILELVGLSKDAAHVHLGLLVFFGALLLARGRRWRWAVAWLAAVLVAVGIEGVDLRDDWRTDGRPRWGASLHDIVNTLLWPTILALAGRFGLGLGRSRGDARR